MAVKLLASLLLESRSLALQKKQNHGCSHDPGKNAHNVYIHTLGSKWLKCQCYLCGYNTGMSSYSLMHTGQFALMYGILALWCGHKAQAHYRWQSVNSMRGRQLLWLGDPPSVLRKECLGHKQSEIQAFVHEIVQAAEWCGCAFCPPELPTSHSIFTDGQWWLVCFFEWDSKQPPHLLVSRWHPPNTYPM